MPRGFLNRVPKFDPCRVHAPQTARAQTSHEAASHASGQVRKIGVVERTPELDEPLLELPQPMSVLYRWRHFRRPAADEGHVTPTTTLDQLFGIGTIDPLRANTTVRAYVDAFFRTTLRGRPSALLERPSATYPEMESIEPASGGDR